MTTQKAFDKTIRSILSEQPNSSASELIRKIASCFPGNQSYQRIFDDFSFSLGISVMEQELIDEKRGKSLGYLPYIKYYPNNKVGEESRVHPLVNINSPMDLKACYSYLAKELLYRLMRVKNIDEFIYQKKQGVLSAY